MRRIDVYRGIYKQPQSYLWACGLAASVLTSSSCNSASSASSGKRLRIPSRVTAQRSGLAVSSRQAPCSSCTDQSDTSTYGVEEACLAEEARTALQDGELGLRAFYVELAASEHFVRRAE